MRKPSQTRTSQWNPLLPEKQPLADHDSGPRVYLSSCDGNPDSFQAQLLRHMAASGKSPKATFTSTPQDADLILIIDIDEKDDFQGLLDHSVWRQFPNKSFGICEGDYPPVFLHGVYSGVSSAWARSGRFQSGAYPVHQACFSNPVPPYADIQATQKELLFSFIGRICHPVRMKLLNLPVSPDLAVVQDSAPYNHFSFEARDSHQREWQSHYWSVASRSKFVICPRGISPSSIRLFEMLEAGIAPVIIADDWLPPPGPDWDRLAVRVPERETERIPEILKAIEHEWKERGELARKAYEAYFAPDAYWDFLMGAISLIHKQQKLPERIYATVLPKLSPIWRVLRAIWNTLRVKAGIALRQVLAQQHP